MRRGIVAVAWLASFAVGVSASADDRPRMRALLVGVNEYRGPVLGDKPLRYAERDVTELGKVLKAQGFDDVKTLVGPAATRAGIDQALKDLLKDPKADDLVLVAFGGHGAQMPLRDEQGQTVRGDQGEELSEAYYCPYDAVVGHPETMVSLTLLMTRLRRESGVQLMLVDACRDDPDEARNRSFRSFSGDELVGRLPKNSAIVFACSSGQRAMETERAGGGHGVFFHHVIEALQGKAADAETGEVTWNDLVSYLIKNVNRRAREWDPAEAARVDAVPRTRGKLQNPHDLRNLIDMPLLAKVDANGRRPVPPPPDAITSRSTGMKLRLIPAGEFLMGSPETDMDADANEKPQKRVTISRSFYLGETEVTQSQYLAVMNANPSATGGLLNAPVEIVSWLDAARFCNEMGARDGRPPFYRMTGESVAVPDWSAEGYRLPTEAEWEYACRAGGSGKFGVSDDPAQLEEYAWVGEDRSTGRTHEVGKKRPNAFGVFDMLGNVYEWCWDGYEDKLRGGVDPRGPSTGNLRVYRGASWGASHIFCRPAYRQGSTTDFKSASVGFRVAVNRPGP